MKKTKAINYERALAVLIGPYLQVKESSDDEDDGVILFSRTPNPEQLAIKKDLWEKLSDEAKEVVNTILDGPAEVLDCFASPKQKRINKRRIQQYYRQLWDSPFLAKMIIEEIKEWAKNIK